MRQILIFLGIVLLCWSCEEDKLDLYKGSDSIYFCYPKLTSEVSNVYMDTTVFSFAMYNVPDTIVRLSVRALGDMVDRDRAFKVKVESATAVAGTNYDELQSEYILPKDSVYGEIPIHIYREGLGDATVSIELRLVSNEYFLQNIPQKIVDKDTIDVTRHVLMFTSKLTKPSMWMESFLGYFSEAKFNFFNQEMGFEATDWFSSDNEIKSSIGNKILIANVYFANYMNAIIEAGDPTQMPQEPENTNEADKGYMTFPGVEIPEDWPVASELNTNN